MQLRATPALPQRLVYYVARDYTDQLRRGGLYPKLTPSIGVIWLLEPVPNLPVRLHTLYELRERDTHERFTDQLAIHVLQPLAPPSPEGFGYHPRVERWARFFTATSDAEYDQLASEDPIMSIAKDALDQLTLRFGPLSDATRAQVEAATLEQRDTWAERILTAATLDAVLVP